MQEATQFDDLLQQMATKYKVDANLLHKLIAFESTKVHLERRRGAKDIIRKMIEDWSKEHSK